MAFKFCLVGNVGLLMRYSVAVVQSESIHTHTSLFVFRSRRSLGSHG